MGLPGGKRRKETLHSKVSESAAHVAGFGLHLEGCGPPNLPEGFFDSLKLYLILVGIYALPGKYWRFRQAPLLRLNVKAEV